MSDKPLDCAGTTGPVGKHDFRAAPRIDDQVDVEALKRELYRAMQHTRLGATYGEKADALKDYITAHYNLTRKGE